jgi:hypothetical protein
VLTVAAISASSGSSPPARPVARLPMRSDHGDRLGSRARPHREGDAQPVRCSEHPDAQEVCLLITTDDLRMHRVPDGRITQGDHGATCGDQRCLMLGQRSGFS